MQAAPVAPVAEPGNITVEVRALDDHFVKLLRLRAIKHQLGELRTEHDRLQHELFGMGAHTYTGSL